jgi:hypothetical protein
VGALGDRGDMNQDRSHGWPAHNIHLGTIVTKHIRDEPIGTEDIGDTRSGYSGDRHTGIQTRSRFSNLEWTTFGAENAMVFRGSQDSVRDVVFDLTPRPRARPSRHLLVCALSSAHESSDEH